MRPLLLKEKVAVRCEFDGNAGGPRPGKEVDDGGDCARISAYNRGADISRRQGLNCFWPFMFDYLCRLSFGRAVLWCYLIWYSIATVLYFDPSPTQWLTSLGIGLMMGLGMLFSSTGFPFRPTNLNRWQIFRFFFMPFCASSFSSTVKGHGFIIILFPETGQTLAAGLACSAFCLCTVGAKRLKNRTKPDGLGTRQG